MSLALLNLKSFFYIRVENVVTEQSSKAQGKESFRAVKYYRALLPDFYECLFDCFNRLVISETSQVK